MIKNNTPLSMAEATEYMNKVENTEIKGFVKKFTNLKPKEAKELRNKLEELNILKLNVEQIIKIVDLLPENSEDLNKIVEMSLDEDETKKILEITKQYK